GERDLRGPLVKQGPRDLRWAWWRPRPTPARIRPTASATRTRKRASASSAAPRSRSVLASVAGEMAVVAVDHGQAGSHVAGEVEGGDAEIGRASCREREGG